jgi:hypothetical protein
MAISLVPARRPAAPGVRSNHPIDELEEALRLAIQLCTRLSTPIEGEQAHGLRMRLARAQALSVVDLLSDIAGDRTRIG